MNQYQINTNYCFSIDWQVISVFFSFEDFFGDVLKKINILEDFLREIIKNKGNIVLEARNIENFRLRRAKIEDFIAFLVLNRPNLGKFSEK